MKTITTGQKDQITTFVKDAARKATEEAVAELEASGALNGDNLQRIIEKGNHVSAEVKKFLKEMFAKLAENVMGCLKLISGVETLTLDACEDSLISDSTEIFDGWIDSDFENYGCNVTGPSTGPTDIQVYEMIKNGDFKTIYGAMSDNLDALCLTQGQIKEFVKKYRNWLRTDGYGTFFLFKANNQFFVAGVYFDSSRLGVSVRHLSSGRVWYADDRHRFVIPQPTLGN